jgi:preprotein translocase subunit YajC
MFIEIAQAMASPGGGSPAESPGMFQMLLPFILMFVIFYFLLIRPQQKKQKQHHEYLQNLKRGDDVVTTGGIYGKIFSVSEQVVTLEVSSNVRIKFAKSSIAGTTTAEKTASEPANGTQANKK